MNIRAFLIILATFYTVSGAAKQIKVAVVDTGLNNRYDIPICDKGYISTGRGVNDTHGHGTNVSYLIHKNAKGADYCQIIIKALSEKSNNFATTLKAFSYIASRDDISIINFSAGGPTPTFLEQYIIRVLINKGKIFVTASGNDGKNLDKDCSYYPACYDIPGVVVVGNGKNGKYYKSSNRGKVVDYIIDGTSKGPIGYVMTGSSQSTAIYTGLLIKKLHEQNKGAK